MPARLAVLEREPVYPADEFVQTPGPERRHALPGFLGDEAEEVDDHLRQADEVPAAQHIVLGRDTGRAVVQMTDAQILAAERDHRRGAEAEALRAEHGGLDHVETGFETAVGLQANLVPQTVGPQHLVSFRQTEFPGAARILDGTQRTRARAAVIA